MHRARTGRARAATPAPGGRQRLFEIGNQRPIHRASTYSRAPTMLRVAETHLQLRDYVDAERERIVERLFEWLRIPSISAHADRAGDVRRSAEFTAQLMRDAGLEHVELLE